MANEWLRLWHEMPNDPKWRVIAKASNQPLSLVISLYTTILVDASKNKSRGVTKCHDEDLAVTLDCDIDQIKAIKSAMQGRVLDGNRLSGWEVRQPKNEDQGNKETGAKSAAERKAEQRERNRIAAEMMKTNACHDESRNVTLDKDKEEDNKPPIVPQGGQPNGNDADAPVKKKPRQPREKKQTFSEWIDEIRAKGEKAVSDYKPVWDYAERCKLPSDFVELAWLRFKDRYMTGNNASKKYIDWRAAFRDHVEGNYLKLWFMSEKDGQWMLTTAGKQADIAAEVSV